MSESTAPTRVGIFVFDEVEVLDCCGPFEVFSVANRVSSLRNGTPPFVVSLIAKTREVSASRGGLALRAHQIIDQDPEIDLLLVSGGVMDAVERDRATISWLSKSQAQVKASICTGAFLLAEAGILTDQRVTTHWRTSVPAAPGGRASEWNGTGGGCVTGTSSLQAGYPPGST